MPVLEINDLEVKYGRIRAIEKLDLQVDRGEVVTLIGANGAGKTTTMRTVAGLLNPSRGSIVFNGQDITKIKGHKRVGMGISLVPEGRGIFPGMTVVENLEMGTYSRSGKRAANAYDRVFDLFPRLKERRTQLGGTMSGGEQQMLAIARALMAEPEVLLLDEPSMGLAPQFIRQIFKIIKEINAQGTTVLLVEQNANQALAIADHALVLETGAITRTGTGGELLADDSIKEAYLGIG
ncbi:ABC transporter ATP-binding protein [Brevibacterium sp. 50QC2O2]|uniref:ABC transporter ATP-binding protein n=1 Tax=Brevibacterium moorei TaxID=2968457 RepID=UPI00211B8C25|nr:MULTISPECIES: ABC transporter ATP-binding protein [unclassified Brevibacterium]MCQ9366841.1 ABC transporter ATP-binding protein [Brevibacterium sp. 91QC2O2]MCQ9383991.1 ABC transporter ATP-binding protein [Brevibacterium sp. 68QC2CO]MCQ9389155.1 ABC transporter ATP-binding protein [Brevibacterium sp. 50QC2O2]